MAWKKIKKEEKSQSTKSDPVTLFWYLTHYLIIVPCQGEQRVLLFCTISSPKEQT